MNKKMKYLILFIFGIQLSNSCGQLKSNEDKDGYLDPKWKTVSCQTNQRSCIIARAAIAIYDPEVVYTPAYVSLSYPNGDVPKKTGVCTDVVIRTYRELGIDLQKLVHEDMKKNFSKYPTRWGLKRPDKNIDHRRDLISIKTGNPIMMHNIGSGQMLEDCLFDYQIDGHYRY